MTLDDLVRIALEEYDGMEFAMDDPLFAAVRSDMRDAVLAVLAAVKRECVPDKPGESESKEYQRGFYAACIDMDCNLDALMQQAPGDGKLET